MKAARRSVAFVSGALLYSFCIGAAVKYAEIGLPRSVYVTLGGRNTLPVMLGEAVALAALIFVISIVWGYVTLRPARRRHRPYVAWMMSGVGLAWAGWMIFGAFSFAMEPRSYTAPLQTMLLSSRAPLFGGLNILGVVLGVFLAGALATRRQMKLPTTRARRRRSVEEAASRSGEDSSLSTVDPHTVPPPP